MGGEAYLVTLAASGQLAYRSLARGFRLAFGVFNICLTMPLLGGARATRWSLQQTFNFLESLQFPHNSLGGTSFFPLLRWLW